jgi:hypothetical protein
MGSTGIPSYSTTPIENETVDSTVTWKEGQLPSTVNNSKRQNLTDIRNAFNDLAWFDYGTGTQDTDTHLGADSVYVSATSFYIEGADVTAVYHQYRPIRAVGVTTGTIYGAISSSSYDSGTTRTTVVVSWNTGAGLQNETITTAILQIPAIFLANTFEIIFEKDGAGLSPSTGVAHDAVVKWGFEILGYYIQADDSGSVVFDIWANTFGDDDPPTVADTITASAKPTLSSQQQKSSTTLTGWTTKFAGPTALRVNIDSVSTITRYTLTLLCRRFN